MPLDNKLEIIVFKLTNNFPKYNSFKITVFFLARIAAGAKNTSISPVCSPIGITSCGTIWLITPFAPNLFVILLPILAEVITFT